MKKWKSVMELSYVWDGGDGNIVNISKVIVYEIKRLLSRFKDEDDIGDLEELLSRFEDMVDLDEFNDALDELYNWADYKKRIWIKKVK